MNRELELIASVRQIYLIGMIEYHMQIDFKGTTKKDVWEFINKHVDDLPNAQLETTQQYYYKKQLEYGKER